MKKNQLMGLGVLVLAVVLGYLWLKRNRGGSTSAAYHDPTQGFWA
jgi:hypothetical protein